MLAAAAELAQLRACLSRPPSVPSARSACSTASARACGPPWRQRPSPVPTHQFGLALQVGGEPGLSFPALGQGDHQARALLVKRARNSASLRGDRLEILVDVASLASRPRAR
jgi:hypothetical protein